MDVTEDLSARVLLRRILVDEPPRTPITNSASQEPGSSSVRSSPRLRQKRAEAKTPQDMVRRSLRQRMTESIYKVSSPPIKRRTASIRNTNAFAASSMLISDGETPRHLLRNILQTEPVKSPVVHKRSAAKEPEPSSADDGTRTQNNFELSGLDLPDLTFRNAESTIKVLGRKRPRQSLNVTAFEKQLKKDDDGEEPENVTREHSSLSLSSSTSLSLKTPFVDIQTEKKVGLRRRVSSRRKLTEEEFGAAIDEQQMEGVHRSVLPEKTLSDTAHSEGFTLGLSKFDVPDITADIVTCSTALYNQPAMTSNFSIIATQDKSTVMASPLQREEEEEAATKAEQVRGEGSGEDQSDGAPGSPEPEEDQGAAGSQTEEEMADIQAEDVEAAEEEAAPDSQSEEDRPADSQTEEEEQRPADSQTEEEAAAESESREDSSPSYQEHAAPSPFDKDDQIDTDIPESQDEAVDQSENVEAESGSEEEENAEDLSKVEEAEEEEEELLLESGGLEHISRGANGSTGAFIVPALDEEEDLDQNTTTGQPPPQSKVNVTWEVGRPDSSPPHSLEYDEAKPAMSGSTNKSVAKEGESLHLLRLTQNLNENQDLSDFPPGEDAAEQEEEWEDDEDDDEFSGKTPAFIKEKRTFFQPDSPALLPVLKDVQLGVTDKVVPPAKPKQTRRRKTKVSTVKPVLSKNYLMTVFRHFAKTKVSPDVYPVLNDTMDKFFDRMVQDLETYAAHAKRKTIEVEDAILLLKRQGHVNDRVPVEVLIEKYLRLEQRKLLIPIATSGNVVVPKKRW